MSKKNNPAALRAHIFSWKESVWFTHHANEYRTFVSEDYQIRNIAKKMIDSTILSKVVIERIGKKITVIIHTHKPGMVIGKDGEFINKLKKKFIDTFQKPIDINVFEVRRPEVDANLVCANIAKQMEQKGDFRRICKRAVHLAIKSGAEGARVVIGGRLNGAAIASIYKFGEGSIPLNSFAKNINFAEQQIFTKSGTCGAKVYINLGNK